MSTPVYIDSCAWNYLFDNQVLINEVLSPGEYRLFITREVEIELLGIPDFGKDGTDKRPLKQYIREMVERYNVQTTAVFGFATYETDGTLSKHQAHGGFGQGGFQPPSDKTWYESPEVRAYLDGKSKRTSGLSQNQADASLGVRASDALVITNELPDKRGPLALAREQGGHVIYLRGLAGSGMSLKDFLRRAAQRFQEEIPD